jgi:DNA-binding CsgD family transcriptional regulator
MGPSSNDELPIGRSWVLAEIEQVVHESAARERPAVVRVCGPPGSGKSTVLAAALSRHAVDLVFAAAASPSDFAEPGACLRRLGLPPFEETHHAESRRPERLDVLCLDDVQWIDELSLRAIGNLIHSGRIRLALFGDRRDAAPGLPSHRSLFLDPLSDGDAARVIRKLNPTATAGQIKALTDAASGLPFNLVVLAHEAARTESHATPHSVYVAVAKRLERAAPSSRDFVRTCALVEGVADLRAIAGACATNIDRAGHHAEEFSDVLVLSGVTIRFRHELLRAAVARFVEDTVPAYRRLLSAYLDEQHATNRSAAVLQCARMCGDDAVASEFAFFIGREAAARGASATAIRYLEIALHHAGMPAPLDYVIEYATVLQHQGREADAAAYLRREVRRAIDSGDAVRASALAMPFSSVAVTLERDAEFRSVCDRIEHMRETTEAVRRRLRSSRLSFLAFSGLFGEYHELAAIGSPSSADYRMSAFVNAVEGREAAARESFERYQAGVTSRDSRQDPADRVLQAVIGLHARGNAALLDLEQVPAPDEIGAAYQAVAQFKIIARVHDGRWAEAAEIVARLPLWDDDYQEPLATLDARLELAALAREMPAESQRTRRSVKALIARGQVRQAVSPARWFLLAVGPGRNQDTEIESFVEATLSHAPPAHLVTGSPISLALLADRFGSDRCLAALEQWPRYGSRWLTAHRMLAYALLTSQSNMLRNARDEFERLGASALAMIGGLALPAPRSRDVELARALGYITEAQHGKGLTLRESDVAELVAQGLTNREIASRLAIRERTVEVHLSNAFRKLELHTRTDLARYVLSRDRSDVR